MDAVFVGSEAVRHRTLSRYQLRANFRAIYPNVYLAACPAPSSLRTRSEAAWLWSGRRGVLAGLAAAALHGSDWIGDDEPVELIWRNQHSPAGVITRNQRVGCDEVTRIAGLPVTTSPRTAFDLARLLLLRRSGRPARRADAGHAVLGRGCAAARKAVPERPRAAAAADGAPASRSRRRVAQGKLAATITHQRGTAGSGNPDTGGRPLPNPGCAGYGLGAVHGCRRIRRGPTPHKPAPMRPPTFCVGCTRRSVVAATAAPRPSALRPPEVALNHRAEPFDDLVAAHLDDSGKS
jgi:hypothetical protein